MDNFLSRRFKRVSIQGKLLIIVISVAALVLLVAGVAFIVNDFAQFKKRIGTQTTTLADVIGANSRGAIEFDDPVTANERLSSLALEPRVQYGAIFLPDGKEFAAYVRSDLSAVDLPEIRGEFLKVAGNRFLEVAKVIRGSGGSNIGTIYLRVGISDVLFANLNRTISIAVIIFIICAVVAAFLSVFFQRVISKPIMEIADLTSQVGETGNYSLRVEHDSQDEIGTLADGFNSMLEEIERRETELQRSNHELEQFAYVASHDLREPLRMVGSFSDLLDDKYSERLGDEGKKWIGFLTDGARRMQALIDDLLQYSRVGRGEMGMETVDLNTVLENAQLNLKVAIEESGGEVQGSDLPVVIGNKSQLELLFQNLIGNALKFRRSEVAPAVQIGIKVLDGANTIFVQDNGIGIDPKYAERVFVIFQRLHGRQDYEGTGLGLAICKKIVEHHGGRIWLESVQDGGTVFYFTLG